MEGKKQIHVYKKKSSWKNDTGRPLLFKSEKELQSKIDDYFRYCDKGKQKHVASKWVEWVVNTITVPIPYTICGLASYLWTNRQTLINYTNKEEFFDTIKRAKEKIEANMEENAMMGSSNATISIFSFKNNFGRVDKTELEHSGEVEQKIVYLPNKK